MGVIYSVFPVDSEVREWLITEGLSLPDSDGHAPTPQQLKAALETLHDQAISFNIGERVWQAQIDDLNSPETGPWTVINVIDYTSPDEPCAFYFEKGWPELIIKVVHRITQQAGPVVVVPDTGCPAVVVEPVSDVSEIINTWAHMTG